MPASDDFGLSIAVTLQKPFQKKYYIYRSMGLMQTVNILTLREERPHSQYFRP